MNDEIKEILRDLEFASGIFDYTITPDRCTFLKDYITDLQQELTIMVRDDERSQETIIRLSKENERLQENNQNMQEEMCRCWQQIDQLTNNWNELEEWLEKQRIRNSEWEKFVQKDTRLGIPIGYLLDKMKEIKENNE